MNPPGSGTNAEWPTCTRISWKYDDDHHIGQYSVENTLINDDDYPSEDDQETSQGHSYDVNERDDSETNQEDGMADFFDEHEDVDDNQQPTQYNNSGNTSGRRRRRPIRKVLGKAWDIPSPAVMQRRNRFREIVHDETKRHRRILPRGKSNGSSNEDKTNADGTSMAGSTTEARPKNVFQLLRDREVFGGGSSNGGVRKSTGRRVGSSNDDAGIPGFRVGMCIASAESDEDDDAEHRRRRRSKKRHRNQTLPSSSGKGKDTEDRAPSPTTVTAASASDTVAETTKPPATTKSSWTPHCHRPTTDELRTYAEHACVTKFESSYLSHLQHEIEEPPPPVASANGASGGGNGNNSNANNANGSANNAARSNSSTSRPHVVQQQQQPNANSNSSKAVSTISIAFAPDGKTMASTHGDHTVKITCTTTGKLLQTLVGHPRTPWTVKYHPHAGIGHMSPNTQKVIIANRTSSTPSSSSAFRSVNHSTSLDDATQQKLEQQELQQQQQQIVASGCLGHQVRIWDWISGTCLQMIRLEFAIISLSFHPSGSVLAIANGTRLHFWGLPTVTKTHDEIPSDESPTATNAITDGGRSTGSPGQSVSNSNNSSRISRIITNPSRGMHIEMRHMLRCVHFLPDGKKVIVGGVNPQTQAEMRRQRRQDGSQDKVPSMSFYLRLWDFDLDAAKGSSESRSDRRQAAARLAAGGVQTTNDTNAAERSTNGGSNSTTTQQQSLLESTQAAAAAAATLGTTRRRRAISNPRCFVPRALLYNDGGFDVSPDGKTLCACAEYWLPEGVNNATELLHPPGKDDDDEDSDCYSSSDDDSSSDGEGKSPNNDNEGNDVNMDDANTEGNGKNQTSPKESPSKAEKEAAIPTYSSSGGASMDAKESSGSKEISVEDSKHTASNPSTSVSHVSPTRPRASSHPSATPPRITGRQPQPIASPLLAVGTSAGAISAGSTTHGLPIPPIQAGMTPQTPPPNVNPLNFPLSPPSPPGRRFAGGLGRGTQPSSQQHEHLLQQYNRQQANRQQAMLNQQRQNQQQQQQQQTMPPPRGGSVSTPPPSRSTENATTIPAPPGINHRNNRQHRLHSHQPVVAGFKKAGNPFATSRKMNPNAQRGRYVPHVVTISLDTEPFVETTTEEVVVSNLVPGETAVLTSHQQPVSSRIRTTTVAATSGPGAHSTTTIVTKTTYNVPGRGTAGTATRPHVLERRPRLGQLLSACPLDGNKASAVTCVKFSPCTDFCLIGYGVREPHVEDTTDESDSAHPPYHPVTAMYKVNKGGTMRHISTMLSGDDDVNIARFHPDSGYGFVYGTKQGRIRILGPRPWNYYNC